MERHRQRNLGIRKVMQKLPTNCGVSHERLLVLQHSVDGNLLAILRCDNGDGRLLV